MILKKVERIKSNQKKNKKKSNVNCNHYRITCKKVDKICGTSNLALHILQKVKFKAMR